jgi:UDP-N-acetylglucosamine 4-epimerase
VANAVQANLLAATETNPGALNQVYNIALGDRTSLNELFHCLHDILQSTVISSEARQSITQSPTYRDFRDGDVRHSQADIGKARRLLGYSPTYPIKKGLELAMTWYVQ